MPKRKQSAQLKARQEDIRKKAEARGLAKPRVKPLELDRTTDEGSIFVGERSPTTGRRTEVFLRGEGEPIFDTAKPEEPGTLEDFTETLTRRQQTEALLDAHTNPQEVQDVLGVLPGYQAPLTTSEAGARMLERDARELKFLEEQNARGAAVDRNRLAELRQQSQGATAGARAALAQNREGPMSQSAPFAFESFQRTVGRQMENSRLQFESAMASRKQAEIRLKEAQDLGQEEFIKTAAANLQRAKQEERRSETEARKTAIDGMNAALKIEEGAAARGVEKTESLFSMGSLAGDLTDVQLESMFQGTNITEMQALTLQKAATLYGEAAEAKTDAEASYKTAQADKLVAETGIVGQSDLQRQFQYMQTLSDTDQDAFMELKRANPNLQYQAFDDQLWELDPSGKNPPRRVDTEFEGRDVEVIPGDTSISDIDITKSGSNAILDYTRIYEGSPDNRDGVDFVAKVGTPIYAQIPGTVASVVTEYSAVAGKDNQMAQNGGWGNQVVVNGADGRQYLYNHLSGADVEVGQKISIGTQLGATGNTGRVMGGDREELSTEQLAAGRGGHLDFTVKEDGQTLSLDEAFRLANAEVRDAAIDSDDFIITAMEESKGGAQMTTKPAENINKAFTVINQLDALTQALELGDKRKFSAGVDFETGKSVQTRNIDFGPLTGFIRQQNPWDAEAQEIEAILTGTIPNVARGIFGEVGVLTDTDIALYKQTLPNLRQTEEVQTLVTAALLRTVADGLGDQLETWAGTGYDVSGLVPKYKRVRQQVLDLERSIGIDRSGGGSTPEAPEVPAYTFDPTSPEAIELSNLLQTLDETMDWDQLQEFLDEGYTLQDVINDLSK